MPRIIEDRPIEQSPDRRPDPPLQVIIDPGSFSVRVILRWLSVALLVLLVAAIFAWIVSSLSYLFFVVVLSIFFAYILAPLVRLIRAPFKIRGLEWLMPRSLAIAVTYVIVFTVLGLAIAYVAPRAVEQGREFGAAIPSIANGIRQSINDMNRRFDRLRVPEEVQAYINQRVGEIGQEVTAAFGSTVLNIVTYLPWLIIVPILSFFFLKDVNLIRLTILRMFPAGRWRLRAESVLEDVNATLAAYTRAQLISCILIGTVCTIGFYFIGLKYALLLGILAGIFEFVPVLGPLSIGVITVTVAAFGEEPRRAIYVFVFLVALRIFHDYVSYPRIVRGGLHLHPLAIILSVLAGEQIAGIAGVFLAIPIVALFTVLFRHVLEHQGKSRLLDGLGEAEPPTAEEAT